MSKKIRLLSVLLCLLLAVSSLSLTASAISYTVGGTIGSGTVLTAVNKNLTSDGAVTYSKATFTDSSSNAQAVYAMEFNPTTSNYMPYVYSKFTGTASGTYATALEAESKYGAEVIGGVNATFFAMSTGSSYAGYWVHDGRLAQATVGYQNDIITFASDGSMKIVNSKLDFKMYYNGKEVSYNGGSGLVHVNKYSEETNVDNRFYYWDAECGTKTDSAIAGIEVLCKKLDYGELSIGNTLKGEVVAVRINSHNSTVGKDEFVLYVKDGSSLQSSISGVKVGDTFEIAVNETIEAAKAYTETANTAIVAQYPIVKNSVKDTAEALSQLGTSFMTARAQRSAIGLKADGSVVLVSSAGRSVTDSAPGLTVYELADLMVQMGCKTAYNLDGGGSTTMVTQNAAGTDFDIVLKSNEGTYGRAVANSIYIVKRQSVDTTISTALSALIDANSSNTATAVVAAIADANAVKANAKSMTSDYTRVYMSLQAALSGKADLDNLIASISAISYKDYSETVLTRLWAAYEEAIELRADDTATAQEVEDMIATLRTLYDMSGEVFVNLAEGKTYTKVGGTNDTVNYQDTDNKELTDGFVASSEVSAYGPAWVGFYSTNRAGTEDGAPYYDVTIDLASVEKNLAKFSTCAEVEWGAGIGAPTKVLVSVSEDGTTFTQAGYATPDISNYYKSEADTSDTTKVNTADIVYTLTLDQGVRGRYVKFHIVGVSSKPFTFISELQVFNSDKPVEQALFVTGYNQMITTGLSVIFTPDYAQTLTGTNANLNWARAIAVQYDDTKKAFYVTQVASGNGSNAITTIPANGFVIGVHGDVGDAIANKAYANEAKVGDIVILHGIDVTAKTMLPGSYITIGSGSVLKESATIRINGNYIEGATNNQSVTEIAAMFNGSVTIKDRSGAAITGTALVGTGSVITAGSNTYTVWIKGDISGDGKIDAKDYLFAKRAFLKTVTLDATQLKAACLSGGDLPTATDYLKIKRHVLGTYNIFAILT